MSSNIEKLEIYVTTSIPSIPLSIIAIVLNIFVVNFYRKNELTVVSLLYAFIAAADILTAFAVLHQFIVLVLFMERLIDGKTVDGNAVVFYSVLQIGYRCSVFFNLVLAVSRTIMILRPFHHIRKFSVKLPCILYTFPWVLLCGINFYMSSHERYFLSYMRRKLFLISSGLADMTFKSPSKPWLIVAYVPDFIAFTVPVMVIIVTCIIQMITLQRSSQFPTSCNQRHVTITVLLMSTLFVICNSAFSLYLTLIGVFRLIGEQDAYDKIEEQKDIITAMLAIVLPILNAAINPVIMIARSSGMRRKFSESVQRLMSLVRGE